MNRVKWRGSKKPRSNWNTGVTKEGGYAGKIHGFP